MATQPAIDSMRKTLEENFEQFLFELNDHEMREKITDFYYDLLNQDIRVKDFAVVCNDSNNPPGEPFRAEIAIQFMGDAEFYRFVIIDPKLDMKALDDQSNPD